MEQRQLALQSGSWALYSWWQSWLATLDHNLIYARMYVKTTLLIYLVLQMPENSC